MNFKKSSTLFLATTIMCCAAFAQETEIKRKDVPPVVLSAFGKAYSGAKVLEWEKEIHGGKLFYEAETVDGKVSRNILYSPDGSVAQVEQKIAVGDIPPAVVEAVKRKYPNASIHNAHKVTHADVVEYGLSLNGGEKKKVVVNADGTIASTEGKTALDRNP